MKTLYDLLEALPDDDADGLRAAFRKAAKANHPDFNPGNPEASERFRRIVRANAILSDEQQRAAYDRLLEVARRQQSQEPKRSFLSGTIRRLAADAIASAVVSVVLIGGYFVFRPVDGLPHRFGAGDRNVQARTGAGARRGRNLRRTRPSRATRPACSRRSRAMKFDVNPPDVEAPAKPDDIAAAATTGIAPASALLPRPATSGPRTSSIIANGACGRIATGICIIALANFDLAIDMDPGLPDSYINRGIVFHRLGDLKRAFSDVAEAKRIEDLNRNKSASVARTP